VKSTNWLYIILRRGRKNDFHPQCGVEDGNLILARLGIFE